MLQVFNTNVLTNHRIHNMKDNIRTLQKNSHYLMIEYISCMA